MKVTTFAEYKSVTMQAEKGVVRGPAVPRPGGHHIRQPPVQAQVRPPTPPFRVRSTYPCCPTLKLPGSYWTGTAAIRSSQYQRLVTSIRSCFWAFLVRLATTKPDADPAGCFRGSTASASDGGWDGADGRTYQAMGPACSVVARKFLAEAAPALLAGAADCNGYGFDRSCMP